MKKARVKLSTWQKFGLFLAAIFCVLAGALFFAFANIEDNVDCKVYAETVLATGDAQRMVKGGMYLGKLYDRDIHEFCLRDATVLYERAAELGDSNAMVLLAAIYEISHLAEPEAGLVARDPKKGWELYKKAADLGNPIAIERVTDATANGKNGEEITAEEEAEWWQKWKRLSDEHKNKI